MRLFHLCVRAWNDKQTYFNSFALRYGHKKVIFWSLISSISIKNVVLKCAFYWGKKLWYVPVLTLRLGLGHVKFLTFLIQFTRQNPQSALYWAEMKNERKRAQRLFFPGVIGPWASLTSTGTRCGSEEVNKGGAK